MDEILFYKMFFSALKYTYTQVIHFLHFDKTRDRNYTSERASVRPTGRDEATEARK